MVSIKILKEEKNKIQLKINGETHTVLNLIRNELFKDDSVEFAGYKIDHPQIKNVVFTVITSKGNPKTIIKKTIEKIQKKLSKIESEIKKM